MKNYILLIIIFFSFGFVYSQNLKVLIKAIRYNKFLGIEVKVNGQEFYIAGLN